MFKEIFTEKKERYVTEGKELIKKQVKMKKKNLNSYTNIF